MNRGRRFKFLAATVLLAGIIAFSVVGTVNSQVDIGEKEREQFYLVKEKEFRQDIREFLQQEGYQNSGVTVTRVVEADGTRNYTVTVHHERIDDMDEAAREHLRTALSKIAFPAEYGSIYHEFLITE